MMGQPQAVAHSPGRECDYFVLLKDFWSRVPWSITDRYYVCYNDGKVESFGKVDARPRDDRTGAAGYGAVRERS